MSTFREEAAFAGEQKFRREKPSWRKPSEKGENQ